jgi:hypothetical protein
MHDGVSIERVKARIELLKLQEKDAQDGLVSVNRPARVHEGLLRLLSRVRSEQSALLRALTVAEQVGRDRLSWSELVPISQNETE